MSRLIVRGLPTYLTDARLREHFSQKGAVTDVKLMRRPDGTSRKFGFVGYRSEQEAQEALDYFNRTFIDTSRITIEHAKKIGDEELTKQREERMNKRKAATGQDSQASTSAHGLDASKGKPSKDDAEGVKKKPKKGGAISFEEFMSVMQPKAKRKAWQNEDAMPEQTMDDIFSGVEAVEKKAAKKAKKQAKAEAEAAAAAAATGSNSAQADADDASEPEPDAAVNDVGLTDEEYMRLRMKHRVGTDLDTQDDPTAPQFEQSDDEKDDKAVASASDSESDSDDEADAVNDEELERKQAAQRRKAEQAAERDQKIVDQIMESGRLFVRNLPFTATDDDIESFFESFGTVKQVHIPLDKQTKASKGLAFVSFSDPAHALAAYRAKDGSTFQGRLLHLLPAVNKDAPADTDKKAATLKQTRADQKKQDATKDFNWSMLYMSADAVASSIADRLGVSKSDILNPGADGGPDNAAVRLALAETRIIQETREFFSQEGINVDAFGTGAKAGRSDTTMLVKNIPYGTSVDEVQKLFEEHGEVDKVLIPPSGTIALVEMPVVSEAKVAFRALAYKRFKGGILYLEKAPVGVLTSKTGGDKVVKQAPIKGKTIDTSANPSANLAAGGADDEAAEGATLYIKNLSFSTTDDRLAGAFHGLSDYAFARVQTKPDPKRPGARLSMGYGFVGFKSVAAARTAQKAMDGKVVDGHTLVVTFARRNAESSTTASLSSSGGSTKILIKNLPFEVTKKDIRDLFASQGQLKSVRLPKKFDNTTRGFGFVEYTTVREAQAAFEALKHTHLLGRHLVLQWSKQGENAQDQVDMQREKTKSAFVATGDATANAKHAKIKLNHAQITSAARSARAANNQDDDDDN
ncbi:hypothetical protein PaG_04771 [Moesziomyces aphidis]|uniref:Multiple RNA-binding domain-containing protein 1 n=1 Tax=Moesziomyces aphidis TaxID=84754 RepID=W3VH14_MOEAP|nr:hypothetical protein PaG_04771 [Moesziomyces aphidis]